MSHWLTAQQQRHLRRGYLKAVETPIPTQVVSSGECYPPRQTREQVEVELLIQERAQPQARRIGLPVHQFLRTRRHLCPDGVSCGYCHGK